MSVSERIKKLGEVKNFKQSDLIYHKIACKQTINTVWHGKSMPSYQFLESLLKLYPDINARWLITGIGDMYLLVPTQDQEGDFNQTSNEILKLSMEISTLAQQVSSLTNENGDLRKKIQELEDKLAGRIEGSPKQTTNSK